MNYSFFRTESRDRFAERAEIVDHAKSDRMTLSHPITSSQLLAIATLCSLFSVLFLISCDSRNFIFNESQSIEEGDWKYADTKAYTFDIADTSKVYNIYLSLDHAEDYAYQNLYLKIHTLFPSGKKMEQQVSFELADKYGKWYGDCGSNCALEVDLQKGAYFNEVGKHTITLEQFMRKDPIDGINELSLMVEETEVVR